MPRKPYDIDRVLVGVNNSLENSGFAPITLHSEVIKPPYTYVLVMGEGGLVGHGFAKYNPFDRALNMPEDPAEGLRKALSRAVTDYVNEVRKADRAKSTAA